MNKGELTLDGIPHDVTTKVLDYLGDSLSAEERDAFEARLLGDELFSRQVEEAEFLLLEAHADGSLPGSVRERIADWIASSPSARRQVEITRALRRITAPGASRRAPHLLLWALAAAACIAAIAIFPILHRRHTASPAVLTARNTPVVVSTPPAEDTILLVAERLRGATQEAPSLLPYPVHPGRPVRLQIVIPSAHTGNLYALTVRREGDDKPVAQFDAIRARESSQAPFIEMMLAPDTLHPGSYVADLSAPSEHFEVAFGVAAAK